MYTYNTDYILSSPLDVGALVYETEYINLNNGELNGNQLRK